MNVYHLHVDKLVRILPAVSCVHVMMDIYWTAMGHLV